MNKHLLSLALAVISFSALARGGVGVPVANGFDSNTGLGYFGSTVLANVDPAGVTFNYQITTTYTATCTWKVTHERIQYPIVRTEGVAVNSALNFAGGGHRIFSGYSLTGFGAPFSSGDTIPVVGADCKKGKNGGVWTDVTQIGSDGGLYGVYGTSQTLIF